MKKTGRVAHIRRVAALALADVRHEWRMSLCLVLAVAAIATPLLLFFGLKHGTVETLRKRLLDNPVTLEIMPVTERVLDQAWFEHWRNNELVSFVVPHMRKLSAQADLTPVREPGGKTPPARRVDVYPTMSGDVLLTSYGAPVPGPDQCVLTEKAAQLLGVKTGDKVTFTVTRDLARVKGTHDFGVAGILPPRANALAGAYIPLEQLESIEAFKDGRAVPAFGWPGSDPLAFPVLSSVLILAPEELGAIREAMLLQNTGFAYIDKLAPDAAPLPGFQGVLYRLRTAGGQAGLHNISAVQDKLRGLKTELLPETGTARLRVPALKNATPTRDMVILPATAIGTQLPRFDLPEGLPLQIWSSVKAQQVPREFLIPSTLAEQLGSAEAKSAMGFEQEVEVVVKTQGEERSLRFTARLLPDARVAEGTVRSPLSLLCTLNLMEQRPVTSGLTEKGQPAFLLGRQGYSGFRMYAAGLELVAPLARALEAENIKANTRADRIDEVLQMDKYLNMLFWLIAAASLAGGTACLLSSIYANVERKRRDLSVLRLLGVHGAALAVFPLVSSLTLTLGGVFVGLFFFQTLGWLINYCFQAHLEPGEQFCGLTPEHQAAAIGLALIMAFVAGLAASRRFATIDPAESLRDE